MLLLLTNKCFEECTHCMEDSNPEGEHMSWETLKKSIKWINLSGARILSVSGGEFTTDPEFYEKIKYIIDNSKVMKITLQSNGSFLREEEKIEKIKKLLTYSKINSLQISTHRKYYKNYEWTISHKSDFEKLGEKILFVGDWQGKRGYLSDEGTSLTYLGRAQNLDFTIT